MGLFDDISYGLGISDTKPSGYDQRTADSIEATRGRDEADRYRADKGIQGAGGSPLGHSCRDQAYLLQRELASYGSWRILIFSEMQT